MGKHRVILRVLAAYQYFTDPKFVGIYKHLGFPQYFRVELGVAKITGVFLLLIPQIPLRLKKWAYVAFGITLLSGAIAHYNSGDPIGYIINVIIFFMLLVISYRYWHKKIDEQIQPLAF